MLDNNLDLYYLRLSKEDGDVQTGDAEESFSIGSQRLCIQRYIQQHPDLGNNFEELLDDGYTGTNFKRPGIMKLLELVESDRVRTIIVRNLSRFARNYLEAGHFLEFVFPAFGVRFISINDGYDSAALGETTAGFQLAIRNLINQLYSKDISRKIKSAVDLKKLNGKYMYGTAPYGYKKGKKRNTIVVDEKAAQVVNYIFKWAADGISITQIAQILNDDKVKSPSEYLKDIRGKYRVRAFWTYESVRNILLNRIYTGDTMPFKSHVVRVGSKLVKQIPEEEQLVLPDTHEAIVSREQYYLARTTVKSNKKSKPTRTPSILSNILVCGCCGNKLQKGRPTNKNFKCANVRYVSEAECCNVNPSEMCLEAVLLRAIQTQCKLTDVKIDAAKASAKANSDESTIIQKQIKTHKQELDQKQAQMVDLYEAFVTGAICKEEYKNQKMGGKETEEGVKIQLIELERRLAELTEHVGTTEQAISDMQPLTKRREITALTPELLRELVQKAIVYPNDSISIVWNFQDNL